MRSMIMQFDNLCRVFCSALHKAGTVYHRLVLCPAPASSCLADCVGVRVCGVEGCIVCIRLGRRAAVGRPWALASVRKSG
jgi:hypothetical protein